jgi:hypothetical protein
MAWHGEGWQEHNTGPLFIETQVIAAAAGEVQYQGMVKVSQAVCDADT